MYNRPPAHTNVGFASQDCRLRRASMWFTQPRAQSPLVPPNGGQSRFLTLSDRCVVHPASSTVSSGLNLSAERVSNVGSFLAGSYQCVVQSAAIVAHKPCIQCEIVRIFTRILPSSCSIGHNFAVIFLLVQSRYQT